MHWYILVGHRSNIISLTSFCQLFQQLLFLRGLPGKDGPPGDLGKKGPRVIIAEILNSNSSLYIKMMFIELYILYPHTSYGNLKVYNTSFYFRVNQVFKEKEENKEHLESR